MSAPVTDAPTTTANGLPPQVTPFSFDGPGDPCRLSVYCPYLTYYAYMKSANALWNDGCQGVQTGGGFGTRVTHREECYPSGYFNIFPNEIKSLHPGGGEPDEGSRSTLAYPGTACLSGWTTACTTTLTHEGAPFSQAWCCPSGGWSCATTTASIRTEAPQRLCQSPLSTSTIIWMTYDPPYTNNGEEIYTWVAPITSEEPQNAATVFHKVFPLQLTAKVESTGGEQGFSGDTPVDGDHESQPGLSKGAIAGTAVGSSVVVLCIAFGICLLFRRRKKRAPEPEAYSAVQQQQDSWEGKPELDGTATAAQPGDAPKSELDAVDAARESTVFNASVSELGALSPRSIGAGDAFPSPESRHSRVFEMQG